MSNPFNITFGEIPASVIDRSYDIDIVKKSFMDETPDTKVYIISGPRGSGKSALLTQLKHDFEKEKFLTVDLNPFNPLEEQLAAKVYEQGKLSKLFLQPEFSFSFQGLTFSLKGEKQINNVFTLLERMFSYLKKKKTKVLVTIDDISSSANMKSFVFTYQQMIREGFDLFLLMSGLYENISELGNNKSLTFFLRAPKIVLKPLNLITITYSYKKLLGLDDRKAAGFAKLTNGYAYGYQLLGSLLYKNGVDSNVLDAYDIKLNENSYSLIWEALTNKEKEILKAMTKSKEIHDIMAIINMTNGNFQTYRKRLMDKGICESKERGKLSYSLPRFEQFVSTQMLLDDAEDSIQ